MVTMLKKIFLDFSSNLINDKKVIEVGKYDFEVNRKIYYVRKVLGEKRLGKKEQITKSKFLDLTNTGKIIKTITY